jgi:hypothetical protein
MGRYIAAAMLGVVFMSIAPSVVNAQVVEKKAPRKYDKLLTAVESFAKLNAQIEIREREFTILMPFIQEVTAYSVQLKNACDSKCNTSLVRYTPVLKKFNDALLESHRRYQALTPNITERNGMLMSEMNMIAFLPSEQTKEKAMVAFNRLNLENIYHYKAYATTYHSADSAMLSLAATSDLTLIINSFATTTDRLVKSGYARPNANMTLAIGSLKSRVPDIRAQIKTLEDRRKSLVCTAALAKDWSVSVHCQP